MQYYEARQDKEEIERASKELGDVLRANVPETQLTTVAQAIDRYTDCFNRRLTERMQECEMLRATNAEMSRNYSQVYGLLGQKIEKERSLLEGSGSNPLLAALPSSHSPFTNGFGQSVSIQPFPLSLGGSPSLRPSSFPSHSSSAPPMDLAAYSVMPSSVLERLLDRSAPSTTAHSTRRGSSFQ